jgi:hypothetical protein
MSCSLAVGLLGHAAPAPALPGEMQGQGQGQGCGSEECKTRIQILEFTIQGKNAEIKQLQHNNKEYILQSSSQLLVQAIQNTRKMSGK